MGRKESNQTKATYRISEGLGESAHMRRLARALAARINKVWM